MPHGPYVVNLTNTAVTAAITLISIKAGAATPLQIIEARCSQSSSTTSAQQRIQLQRITVGSLAVTSFTPLLENTSDAAAAAVGGSAATGVNATVEGTAGDILMLWDFNVLTGFLWQPALEDRIWVAAATFIVLKFPAAPGTSTTYDAQLKFLEYP